MSNAPEKLQKELEKHGNEYVLFIVSLIIPALICILALNAFLAITERVQADQLVHFDDAVFEFVHAYRTESFTRFVTFITDLGDIYAYMVIIPSIAILLYFKMHHRWKLALQATIVLASAFLLNVGIKHLIGRARPLEELRLVTAHSYSFPSGHSMSAIAFYGFLIYLTYKYVTNLPLKIFLIIIQALLILGIGLSRVYLGVHFPTDVAAGFIAGLIWLIICIGAFNFVNFYRKRKVEKQGLKSHAN